MELKEMADFVKDVLQTLEKARDEDLRTAYRYGGMLTSTEEGRSYFTGMESRRILPRILTEAEKREISL